MRTKNQCGQTGLDAFYAPNQVAGWVDVCGQSRLSHPCAGEVIGLCHLR